MASVIRSASRSLGSSRARRRAAGPTPTIRSTSRLAPTSRPAALRLTGIPPVRPGSATWTRYFRFAPMQQRSRCCSPAFPSTMPSSRVWRAIPLPWARSSTNGSRRRRPTIVCGSSSRRRSSSRAWRTTRSRTCLGGPPETSVASRLRRHHAFKYCSTTTSRRALRAPRSSSFDRGARSTKS